MNTVTLNMIDELTGAEVTRTIDKANAMSIGDIAYELKGKNEQRENLERWISERGNDQHETILSLVSWNFN